MSETHSRRHDSNDIVGGTPAALLGRDAELTAAFLAD
jgi:hypothetical protein